MTDGCYRKQFSIGLLKTKKMFEKMIDNDMENVIVIDEDPRTFPPICHGQVKDESLPCKDCGECCGMVPFKKEVYLANLSKIQTKVKETITLGDGQILPVTNNLQCCFLTSDKRCSVYGSRPEVCRLYGKVNELPCPYFNIDGSPRSNDESASVKRSIEEKIDIMIGEKL